MDEIDRDNLISDLDLLAACYGFESVHYDAGRHMWAVLTGGKLVACEIH